jgi:hypothetical protein
MRSLTCSRNLQHNRGIMKQIRLLTIAALMTVFAIGCGSDQPVSTERYTIKVYSAGVLVETYEHATMPIVRSRGEIEFEEPTRGKIVLGPGTEFTATPFR